MSSLSNTSLSADSSALTLSRSEGFDAAPAPVTSGDSDVGAIFSDASFSVVTAHPESEHDLPMKEPVSCLLYTSPSPRDS